MVNTWRNFAKTFAASFVEAKDPSVEVTSGIGLTKLKIRAFPNAPDGYTPKGDNYPLPRPSVRSASRISPNERSWVSQRRKNTLEPMQVLLGRLNITGFDVETYFSNHTKNISNLPNIAIAASGGGYRVCLNGGGATQAFDSLQRFLVLFEACCNRLPTWLDYQVEGGSLAASMSTTIVPSLVCLMKMLVPYGSLKTPYSKA